MSKKWSEIVAGTPDQSLEGSAETNESDETNESEAVRIAKIMREINERKAAEAATRAEYLSTARATRVKFRGMPVKKPAHIVVEVARCPRGDMIRAKMQVAGLKSPVLLKAVIVSNGLKDLRVRILDADQGRIIGVRRVGVTVEDIMTAVADVAYIDIWAHEPEENLKRRVNEAMIAAYPAEMIGPAIRHLLADESCSDSSSYYGEMNDDYEFK